MLELRFFNAPERVFESSQWIARPIEEIFAFFSNEANLERLTPPWLNFKVLGKSTPHMEAGTLIDYQLRLSGLPFKWKTRIESWEAGRSFVDIQLSGPYRQWHHTHTFTPKDGGTLMTDRVIYQLPMGRLGDAVAAWKVRRQVEMIFTFRRQAIEQIFA